MGKWILGMLALLLAAPAFAQVDVDAFLKRDTYEDIKISPDGAYLAATIPLEDRTVLAVLRRKDGVVTSKAMGGAQSVIDDFWWASNERVVVSIAERLGSRDQPYATGELHAVSVDGSRPMTLASPYGINDKPGLTSTFKADFDPAVFMVDPLREDPINVLVSAEPIGTDTYSRIERMNVFTRHRVVIARAPVRNATFTTDSHGEVRFVRGADYDNVSKLFHRSARGDEWTLVNDEAQSHLVVAALGLSSDGGTAYLQAERANGPDEILALDVASGVRTPLLRDERVDPLSIIRNPATGVPVGAWFMRERITSRFFDEGSETALMYRSLEKAFPGLAVAVTSITQDGTLALLRVWSDRNSGEFFIYDTRTHQALGLYARRMWIPLEDVPPTTSVDITAHDGTKLHGYLTRPVGSSGPLPMVVQVHGGPFGVFDGWEFDDDAQILVRAGYAVLRVNYRGSGNYGRGFMQAGAQQWGLAMQDDITDATRWAITQNIADPKRVCIYGASYGGYVALMGVVREPSLYACAAGYVGVYDLERMSRESGRKGRSIKTWTGEWIGARGELKNVSPVHFADRIKVPVFLAAGGKDERAPIGHSRDMEAALRKAGGSVRTLYFPSEGHGFYSEEHRRAYYVALLDFLAGPLGGQRAKQVAKE